MVYEYRCESCRTRFDVIKPASQYDSEEKCSTCNTIAVRSFVPSRLYLSGTKVEEAEYNPGLGCIVKNKNHRKEIAKIKGVEEIGNESPDKIHQHFETRRNEAWEQSWATADKGWVGEG